MFLSSTDNINTRIVKVAMKYLGEQENAGNLGWKDKLFEAKMKLTGWNRTEAWCAYFAELVWKEAYLNLAIESLNLNSISDPTFRQLDSLFSPSAVATWSNFKGTKDWSTSNQPRMGSLVCWRHGDTYKGHIGVVVEINLDAKIFFSVEGNTNAAGGREGIEVAKKRRTIDFSKKAASLNLLGFVHPKDI